MADQSLRIFRGNIACGSYDKEVTIVVKLQIERVTLRQISKDQEHI